MRQRYLLFCLFLVAFSLGLMSCNAFNFMDKPSGDVQLLSAARACFDHGDFTCANNYYSQLSTNSADTQNSEEAFEILAQNGASMSTFLQAAVGQATDGGQFITKLASNLATGSQGYALRLAMFSAYQKVASIQDSSTRGLVRFIAASAFLAEILAETSNSTTPGILNKTDFATNPTGCKNAADSDIVTISEDCVAPTWNQFVSGATIDLNSATTAQIQNTGSNNQPTYQMILTAASQINTAITEMGATGKLGSSSKSFATQLAAGNTLLTSDTTPSKTLFRHLLLTLDLGE